MRIEPLRELSEADAHRLIVGYRSTQRYDVTKTETREKAAIELTLVDLARPFEKRFPLPSRMIEWYGVALRDGLSFRAMDGDDFIGLTVGQRQWNGIAMVWELHVDEPHRRQGIGRSLLESVESSARSLGLRAVSIETQTSNVPALDFYRSCGYAIGAVDLSFYNNDDVERGEVDVFMRKPLT